MPLTVGKLREPRVDIGVRDSAQAASEPARARIAKAVGLVFAVYPHREDREDSSPRARRDQRDRGDQVKLDHEVLPFTRFVPRPLSARAWRSNLSRGVVAGGGQAAAPGL